MQTHRGLSMIKRLKTRAKLQKFGQNNHITPSKTACKKKNKIFFEK